LIQSFFYYLDLKLFLTFCNIFLINLYFIKSTLKLNIFFFLSVSFKKINSTKYLNSYTRHADFSLNKFLIKFPNDHWRYAGFNSKKMLISFGISKRPYVSNDIQNKV